MHHCDQLSICFSVCLIDRFKNNKSPAPDNIGPRLLKAVTDEIADPSCCLLSLSFLTSVVPNTLRFAKVIVIIRKVINLALNPTLLSVID